MVQCGLSGSTRIVNTEVQNKFQAQTDSTLCSNLEKYSPCLATLSKSYQTMELHSLQENSANSAFNTKSGISDQHRITLQQTTRPNAFFKRAFRANSDQTSYSSSKTSASKFDTECDVHRFLHRYRTLTHFTTRRTYSELLFRRTIRTTLNLIRYQVQKRLKFSTSFSSESRQIRSRSIL